MANRKAATKPATLTADSTASERKSANDLHHQSLVEHTIDAAEYGGHGHFVGSQGKRGHDMPANEAHKQLGQYIPRAVRKAAVNATTGEYSQQGSPDADDQSVSDSYGHALGAGQ
jgi:hypothetical protein